MPRTSFTRAAADLAARDPIVARMVEEHGPVRFGRRRRLGAFESLLAAIVSQQLSGKAARTIHGRVMALVDDEPTPEAIARVPFAKLRKAGLSGQKATYISELARNVISGRLELDGIHRLKDEEIIERLTQAKGIGRWTVEMYLMFQLRRLDVWPVADLGVQKGFMKAFGLKRHPKPKRLAKLGDRFRPYRSLVAWYCWRETEK